MFDDLIKYLTLLIKYFITILYRKYKYYTIGKPNKLSIMIFFLLKYVC